MVNISYGKKIPKEIWGEKKIPSFVSLYRVKKSKIARIPRNGSQSGWEIQEICI